MLQQTKHWINIFNSLKTERVDKCIQACYLIHWVILKYGKLLKSVLFCRMELLELRGDSPSPTLFYRRIQSCSWERKIMPGSTSKEACKDKTISHYCQKESCRILEQYCFKIWIKYPCTACHTDLTNSVRVSGSSQ